MPKHLRTKICEVPSYNVLQKVRTLVFNHFAIDIYGITGRAKDTEFSYFVYTEKRLNKALLSAIQSYIDGIIDTLRSF